jgi:hypothetical protein
MGSYRSGLPWKLSTRQCRQRLPVPVDAVGVGLRGSQQTDGATRSGGLGLVVSVIAFHEQAGRCQEQFSFRP